MLDVEDTISKLTTTEKCNLLSLDDWWHTHKVARLNVPAIRLSDGPNGVRGQHHFNSTKTTCFPVATGLAATWNKELMYKVGEVLSEECKLKGARLLLGPTINMLRGPLGGRAFESFSEDPVLSGLLAAGYINGVQAHGVGCSLKHLVCNDQEFERNSADSIVSDRALREIYLMPFQLAVRDSKPLSIMTSYNKLNGVHCSESKELLQGIVRGEWDWKGLIVSDWKGTYSTVEAIKAGLDLELPGPSVWRRGLLELALFSKKLSEFEIDERVRNVLQFINDTESSGIKENAPELLKNYKEDALFLRETVAEGVVLLKNENNELPLTKSKKTAVIGFNAAYAAYAGGGSSLVNPYYKVSPLQLFKSKLGAENLVYEPGAYSFKFLPSLGESLQLDDGTVGVRIKIYNHPRGYKGGDRELVDDLVMEDIGYFRMNDYYNDKLNDRSLFYADIESTFIPEHTGEYLLGLAVHGTAKLYIDGVLVVDNATHQERGTAFYGMGASEVRSAFKAELGRKYHFDIEFGSSMTSSLVSSGPEIGGGGGLISGGILNITPEEAIVKAVKIAKECDQAIIVTGLNKEWESEGSDRVDLSLPFNNDDLIKQVLKLNPKTVVVIQSGSPVDMTKWVDDCSSLLHLSYGGDENGNGLADVVFGDVCPSGKLPLSFPLKIEDNPTFINFGADRGKVYYGEGVYIGYRFYEKLSRQVLFPFGYGLSYTDFQLQNLQVKIDSDDDVIQISVDIANIGEFDGSQVVQVYVKPLSPSIKRPIKELKEFTKVHVPKGEIRNGKVGLPLKYATSFWDEERDSWISEAGDYEILIGDSSDCDEFLVHRFKTDRTIYWKGV